MLLHHRRSHAPGGADRALRLALAGAALAVVLALFVSGPGYALPQASTRTPDVAPTPSAWTAWTVTVRAELSAAWTTVWSPIGQLFSATATDGTSSTDGGYPSDGSGVFDPGGGGSYVDPNGAF